MYLAVDHIDNEFVSEMGFGPDGHLFQAVSHDANFRRTDVSGNPKWSLDQGYEQKDGEDHLDLDELVGFASDSTDAEFQEGAAHYLSPHEFEDWFLFVHYANAEDSGGKNDWLYHDPSTSLWRYIPWDYNDSWGQDWMTLRITPDAYDDFTWTNEIFVHDLGDPVASAEIWDRFHEMQASGGPLDVDVQLAHLDAYYAQIDPSAARDWEKWKTAYQHYSGWAYYRQQNADWTDYDGEKAYLYDWVRQRDVEMRAYHP